MNSNPRFPRYIANTQSFKVSDNTPIEVYDLSTKTLGILTKAQIKKEIMNKQMNFVNAEVDENHSLNMIDKSKRFSKELEDAFQILNRNLKKKIPNIQMNIGSYSLLELYQVQPENPYLAEVLYTFYIPQNTKYRCPVRTNKPVEKVSGYILNIFGSYYCTFSCCSSDDSTIEEVESGKKGIMAELFYEFESRNLKDVIIKIYEGILYFTSQSNKATKDYSNSDSMRQNPNKKYFQSGSSTKIINKYGFKEN